MATDRLKKKIGKGRHASSLKRDRQNIKLRARNKQAISKLKTAIKRVRTERSKEALTAAIPLIAKGASKRLIHRKKASRLISRLTKAVSAA